MNYQDKIQELCELSPLIENYIGSQLYRLNDIQEDQIDDQDLMVKCYAIILQMLKELGIETYNEWDDVLADYYTADGFVSLFRLLQTDLLTKLFTTYSEIQLPLRNILEDTEIRDDDIFPSFISLYQRTFPGQTVLINSIERIDDLIYSTTPLRKHLLAILDKSVPTSDIELDDINLITSFNIKTIHENTLFQKIIEFILSIDKQLSIEYLNRKAQQYKYDLISGSSLKKHAWAFTTNSETLDESSKKYQQSIITEYKTKQTFDKFYYVQYQIVPSPEQYCEIISHCAVESHSKELFKSHIQEIISFLQSNLSSLLDDTFKVYLKKYMIRISSEIFNNWESLFPNEG